MAVTSAGIKQVYSAVLEQEFLELSSPCSVAAAASSSVVCNGIGIWRIYGFYARSLNLKVT